MSTQMQTTSAKAAEEVEFVTFYVGNLLIGADIHQVEEINRLIGVTAVPHAPKYVRGVINLRGEVVTVVDLREILGLADTDRTGSTRTVVVRSKGEQIGLLVDRIADVILTSPAEIDPPPANVSGADGRFFTGICKLETELLVILDVDTVLTAESASR